MSKHGPYARAELTPKQKEKVYYLKKKEGLPMSIIKERFGCSINTLVKACKEVERNQEALKV